MFIKADVRCGSRLCENSDVELARRKFVSITLNNKRTALAVTVERRKERTQFCAFSARARFHTAWVKTGKARYDHMFSALPLKADIALRTRYVRFVPKADLGSVAIADGLLIDGVSKDVHHRPPNAFATRLMAFCASGSDGTNSHDFLK